MECGKAPSGVRKVKKKQVKDGLDRIKQAEKKKRRLEKALATSAAIISELEKKKQKKKEEQQRLDEECAAIAEAVALQVLIGEESDDSCVQAMMQKDEEFNPWDCCAGNFDIFVGEGGARTRAAIIPHPQQLSGSPTGETGWVSGAWGGSRCPWNGDGLTDGGYVFRDVQAPYIVERGWEATEVSAAGLIAAQAFSSLQIADDGVNALVFNRILKG